MGRLFNAEKPEVGYSPIYCAMYPELAKLAREHGYALAVHGSMRRDMDLVCIPWTEDASEPQAVLDAIMATFAIELVHEDATPKPHGRFAYSLSVGFGECALDLSFMPRMR